MKGCHIFLHFFLVSLKLLRSFLLNEKSYSSIVPCSRCVIDLCTFSAINKYKFVSSRPPQTGFRKPSEEWSFLYFVELTIVCACFGVINYAR